MIICESTRYLTRGFIYKEGQSPMKVENEVVYDLYDTNTQDSNTYTKEEMFDYLKNNKVFNASLGNNSIKTIGLSRTYANDNKEEKRLFLYTYKDYAIIGFPKATFVGCSYSGNCKALFIKGDTILKEIDNFCSSASNSNSSFSIEDVKEQDDGYLFHLEAYDEGVYDEKDVFCERK